MRGLAITTFLQKVIIFFFYEPGFTLPNSLHVQPTDKVRYRYRAWVKFGAVLGPPLGSSSQETRSIFFARKAAIAGLGSYPGST